VQAVCFGPGEAVNQTLVAAGLKMPCGYAVKPGGLPSSLVDYWEEAVCSLAVQANCYCYALDRQSTRGYWCVAGGMGQLLPQSLTCRGAHTNTPHTPPATHAASRVTPRLTPPPSTAAAVPR
jgi:hypothetical protein